MISPANIPYYIGGIKDALNQIFNLFAQKCHPLSAFISCSSVWMNVNNGCKKKKSIKEKVSTDKLDAVHVPNSHIHFDNAFFFGHFHSALSASVANQPAAYHCAGKIILIQDNVIGGVI